MKKGKFSEHSCDFKNENSCEEELEDESTSVSDAEGEFYEDQDSEL